MTKNDNEREYRCKIYEPKNTVSSQYGRENVYEVPWPTARARVPREDAVRTKSLGTEATPRRPLGTIQFWEFLERKLKCCLNQQVTCILEKYIYIYSVCVCVCVCFKFQKFKRKSKS